MNTLNRRIVICLGGLAALAMSGGDASAAGDRVGVVQLERVLQAHPDVAPNEAVLEKHRQDFEAERRDMLKERGRIKEAFDLARKETENRALNEDARAAKFKETQEHYVALREYEREIRDTQLTRQKELNDQHQRMRGRIIDSIREVIQAYAEEKGFAVVLSAVRDSDGEDGGVLYHAERVDITEAIVERVEKKDAAE